MRRPILGSLLLTILTTPVYAAGEASNQLQEQYRQGGAGPFSAQAGQAFWNREFPQQDGSPARSCTTCHTADLNARGEHVRTGKEIEPMAPSANPERLTEMRKMKKWFLRNCKWTLGRECTAQEKGDVLEYLKTQ